MFEHADTDTNMYLERLVYRCSTSNEVYKKTVRFQPVYLYECFCCVCSFHNKLKTNPAYFGGKMNRRVDYLLHTLLKFEEDMFLARQQKLLGMKSNRKATKERKRHEHGAQLAVTMITVSGTKVM